MCWLSTMLSGAACFCIFDGGVGMILMKGLKTVNQHSCTALIGGEQALCFMMSLA